MKPENDLPQNTLAESSHGAKIRTGSWILFVLCLAALMFLALVFLWLGQTSSRVYADGANALVIRAVLRTDTSEVAAENLAGRIRQAVPDISVDLINEAMGRSLLALQEPWIAQMPDFEVTPLPMLLEMRHPELLTRPQEVSKFVDKLKTEREVDFVAYNETAHDKLTKLAGGTAAIERHAIRWTLLGLAVVGTAVAGFFFSSLGYRTFPPLLVSVIVLWAGALLVSAATFRAWESAALELGDWQRIAGITYAYVASASLLLIMAAACISMLWARLRQ